MMTTQQKIDYLIKELGTLVMDAEDIRDKLRDVGTSIERDAKEADEDHQREIEHMEEMRFMDDDND